MLLATLAMTAMAMTSASAATTTARALRRALQAVAFARIVMGLTLALILSGLIRRLSFRRRLEGLVLFCVEAECRFHLDPCVEAGVEAEVIIAIAYGSTYLQTQSSQEHALVVISNVTTPAGSDNIGAE
jgi:hypothetical protein